VKAVLRVLSIFAFIPFFWMLFDQKASTWVVQARSMDLRLGPWTFEPSQIQLVNPALVMLLIPFTPASSTVLQAARLGADAPAPDAARIALGATAFVIAGILNMPVAPASASRSSGRSSLMWCSPWARSWSR